MTNKVTGIMLAAANMEPERIYTDINSRKQWPFKAETPEHGLDIPRIFNAAQQSKTISRGKDVLIFVVSLFGFIVPFLAIPAVAVIQFVFLRSMRRRAREVLREIADEADATSAERQDPSRNVLISGGYAPFLGAGFGRRAWSFTVDLRKAANESMPVLPVTARALYDETQAGIEKLRLPGLALLDTVCVDGRDVGEVPSLMRAGKYHRPESSLPQQEVESLVGRNDMRMRHYKLLRADLWGGQLLANIYFRYVIQAGLLFVEARTFVLPPLRREFRDYESMPSEPDFREYRNDALRSLVWAPFLWLVIGKRMLSFIFGGWLTLLHDPAKKNAQAIDRNRKFNYGWTDSLREHWAANEYERYFQGVDLDFYEKSLQEALLDSMQTALKARNVSVEAFAQASTTIFNQGIMMSGGTLTAQSMAVGLGGVATAVNKVLSAGNTAAKQTSA